MIRNEKDLEQEIEYDIGNFFDRKKKFDFRHYDLFKLELSYLKTNELKVEKDDEYEDLELKKQLKEFYKMNNQLILENFQVHASQEIISKFYPNFQKVQIADEVIESSFCKFYGITDKKKYDLIVK